jgi:hypothetical protein
MISWSEDKNNQLKEKRGVSFEGATEEILAGRLLDLIPHPARPNQQIYIIRLNGYVHGVPFVEDEEGNIFLKTIYPSRGLQKKYGGRP